MPKLLVNTPGGVQEVIEISDTGGYFDSDLVVWDERDDGPLPTITLGKMQRVDDQLTTLDEYLPEHAAVLLAGAKTAKIDELKAAYAAANYADIDNAAKTWKADRDSQQLLATVLSVGSVPPGMYWRDSTETQNPMTYSDLQALAAAILDRGLLLDSNLDTKKSAVEAATTIEEVNAITW